MKNKVRKGEEKVLRVSKETAGEWTIFGASVS